MSAGIYRVPTPVNEPITSFRPGSSARAGLSAALDKAASEVIEIPCVIGGKHVYTGNTVDLTMPCDHGHVLARCHVGGEVEVNAAIDAAEDARADWAALPWEQRVGVFLKAAALLAGPRRDVVNAATMLGQSKTCYQAEIDSACELIDFWRFNAVYTQQILGEQPPISTGTTWNRLDHRPLDGFVFSVTPFNFSSIALNLPTAPAFMGNTNVWKPAQTSMLSCWRLLQVLEEAGLPAGVINMVNGPGRVLGPQVFGSKHLAGLHFTGSTATFNGMWRTMAENLDTYGRYPRIVGETGGKDFIWAHPSTDPTQLAVAILRGSFEYQGQKCSASSRLYIPDNLWPEVRDQVVAGMAEMKMGDVRDMSNFTGAVIDKRAFDKHVAYLNYGKENAELVAGGGADGSKGWFVENTMFKCDDPMNTLMVEEIFGPIVSAHVYDASKWEETLPLVDRSSPYALTGGIFARDRKVIHKATEALRGAAGNFYVNDKPTGAVVGQQPFGGGRASGTNDKAGSPLNLLRWTSPRSIKENFVAPTDWRYPFMG
jgi:1-pyrroline-5-carboxylate dehydrogenase